MHWNRKVVGDIRGHRGAIAVAGAIAAATQAGAMIPPFDEWEAEGDATEWIHSRGSEGEQMTVMGFSGESFLNSYTPRKGDGSTGRLLSPEFSLDAPWMSFLIGGGNLPEEAHVRLLVEGESLRRATGLNSEVLSWHSWDIRDLVGKRARLEILDEATGRWGHILVDDFRMDGSRRMIEFPNPEINAPMGTLMRAIEHVGDDPTRPRYHFHPPALWINDPNAPFFANGWYHLFYQHHPYGDLWGPMHWGHARSRDLVTWEHLPIAMAPELEKGEGGVWSGSAAIRADGTPIIFYTSIRHDKPANEYAEQNAAVPIDQNKAIWKRVDENPLLTPNMHGDLRVEEWRDPFVFEHEGRMFMVLAGRIVREDQNKATAGVLLYEANDDSLLKWSYRGIVHEQDLGGRIMECPNLFLLGGKWVLILSAPGWTTEYHVGTMNLEKPRFIVERSGVIDHGVPHFYAPNTLVTDPRGRKILWGWIRDFPKGRGWSGALSLPRVLSIGPEGQLLQDPLPELSRLRLDDGVAPASMSMADGEIAWDDLPGSCEIQLAFHLPEEGSLEVSVRDQGTAAMELVLHRNGLTLGDRQIEHPFGAEVELRLFLDRSVAELFINKELTVSTVIPLEAGHEPTWDIRVSGPPLSNAHAWTIGDAMSPFAPAQWAKAERDGNQQD